MLVYITAIDNRYHVSSNSFNTWARKDSVDDYINWEVQVRSGFSISSAHVSYI